MKLCDYLTCDLIAESRDEAIEELVQVLANNNKIKKEDVRKITNVVIEREKKGSTVITKNIAVPHGKCIEINESLGVIGRSENGVIFDGHTRILVIFLLISSLEDPGDHLRSLANISLATYSSEKFNSGVEDTKNAEEVKKLICD